MPTHGRCLGRRRTSVLVGRGRPGHL